MMVIKRNLFGTFSLVAMALLVTACSPSARFDSNNRVATTAPSTLPPVQSSSVQSSSLPPLQGQDGVVTTNTTFDPLNNDGFDSSDPSLSSTQTANTDGSFVSLDDTSGGTMTPGGRDLSGGLTASKLLGVWTVKADLQTCRLNLTQTTKSGTNRYRASAPNCTVPTLALVSSWQLTGTQVQLYDESGSIIGAMQLSGNRFIGSLSGGISVTMEG